MCVKSLSQTSGEEVNIVSLRKGHYTSWKNSSGTNYKYDHWASGSPRIILQGTILLRVYTPPGVYRVYTKTKAFIVRVVGFSPLTNVSTPKTFICTGMFFFILFN